MESLNVILADDEPLARERMTRLLLEAGCTVLAQLEDGPAVLDWMAANRTARLDVLFLDIQMPGINGLETLAELKAPPAVVIVTAFKEYAIQAFEAAAVDYLLKPVFSERLAKSLERVRERQVRRLTSAEWKALLPPLRQVSIRAGAGWVFMELTRITHFELIDEKVIAFHDGKAHPTRWISLRDVEQAFPEDAMVRIQRNILLRPETVIGCQGLLGGRLRVRLPKGLDLVVSRSMANELKGRLRLEG